jgi:hypothetical protein
MRAARATYVRSETGELRAVETALILLGVE